MAKFYFGMETMRVTQNYNGTTSHYNHSHGSPKDYPLDLAGEDGGKSAYFSTVEMQVVNIKWKGATTTNTVWLKSTKKVQTPTFIDYVWLTLTHFSDNDPYMIKHCKINDIIKAGEIICLEGVSGASANHLHVCCGRGNCNNWIRNTRGSLVMNGNSLPFEKVMFIKKDFTKVAVDDGIKLVDYNSMEDGTLKKTFFPSKGYWGYGDTHENVGKIAKFMYSTFPAYTSKKALGNYYGVNLKTAIKEFQKRTGLERDGNTGPKTLEKLKKYGFKE